MKLHTPSKLSERATSQNCRSGPLIIPTPSLNLEADTASLSQSFGLFALLLILPLFVPGFGRHGSENGRGMLVGFCDDPIVTGCHDHKYVSHQAACILSQYLTAMFVAKS